MNLTALWDTHTLVYALLTAFVILLMLWLLSMTNRQVRRLTHHLEAVQRELGLVNMGLDTVTHNLARISSNNEPTVAVAAEPGVDPEATAVVNSQDLQTR